MVALRKNLLSLIIRDTGNAVHQNINQRFDPLSIAPIALLSIGTGVNPAYIKGKNIDWGYAQWIKPLINILMDGVAGISDYQAKQILAERYHRLQVVFSPNETIALDAVKKIPRMDEIGSTYDLTSTREWINNYWI